MIIHLKSAICLRFFIFSSLPLAVDNSCSSWGSHTTSHIKHTQKRITHVTTRQRSPPPSATGAPSLHLTPPSRAPRTVEVFITLRCQVKMFIIKSNIINFSQCEASWPGCVDLQSWALSCVETTWKRLNTLMAAWSLVLYITKWLYPRLQTAPILFLPILLCLTFIGINANK